MLIRPENRARYPANWRTEIRPAVLARAAHRCERCGIPNRAYRNNTTGEFTMDVELGSIWGVQGYSVTFIVLTIAHLNHTPEDCRPENLQALCQRCHLALDLPLHQMNARKTRRAGRAIEMFEDD